MAQILNGAIAQWKPSFRSETEKSPQACSQLINGYDTFCGSNLLSLTAALQEISHFAVAAFDMTVLMGLAYHKNNFLLPQDSPSFYRLYKKGLYY